jgi:hypothetical protein
LFDDEVVECPDARFAELRDRDPVYRIEGTDAFPVSRQELVLCQDLRPWRPGSVGARGWSISGGARPSCGRRTP